MLILAFDCTAAAVSVAVWRDGATLASARDLMARGQAEALAPMIEACMKQAKVAFADLSRIAVTVGPGSFTGVRVGLAAARGFGLALEIPVIGVTTGDVLQAGCATRGTVISAIDSKRGDVYAEAFAADGTRLSEAVNLPIAALATWAKDWPRPLTLVGDGATIAQAALNDARVDDALALPDAAALAALAATATPLPEGPLPLYVRPPDVNSPDKVVNP